MVTFNLHGREQAEPFQFELGRLSALVADMEAIQRGIANGVDCEGNGRPPLRRYGLRGADLKAAYWARLQGRLRSAGALQ